MGRFVSFLLYGVVRLWSVAMRCLPFALTLRLAGPVGFLSFHLLKRQRETCLDNLTQAFYPEKSGAQIRRLALGSFRYLAEFGFEWIRLPELAREADRYLGIRHVERLHEAYRLGRGVLILASHIGNQEIMALIAGRLIAAPVGAQIYALARPLQNPLLYGYTVHMRGLTGLKSVDKNGGVRSALKLLKQGHIVCVVADQRVREGSLEAKFFGRTALTTSLPAIAALRYDVPLFYAFLERTSDLRYVLTLEDAPPAVRTGRIEEDLLAVMQTYNDRLEREIRKRPEHWLWMHNRWRLYH